MTIPESWAGSRVTLFFERTQTNWNGIVGRMELRATDPVWIDDVRFHPDAAGRNARIKAVIGSITGKSAAGRIALSAESYNTADPALVRLSLNLDAEAGDAAFSHAHTACSGMRDFTRDGSRLLLNGRPVFLRGRIDRANFPLTGYAPMEKDEWLRLMRIHKDWGLNHTRCHPWRPSAAAFGAADETGTMPQPELPHKRSAFNAPDNTDAAWHNIDSMEVETTGTDVSLYAYGMREGGLIFRHFGNSPSFALFTLGNEPGRNRGMYEMVANHQKIDPRHLHARGSHNMHWKPGLVADTNVGPGKLLEAEGDPEGTLRTEGVGSVNPRRQLDWTIQLHAGREKELTYRCEVVVRR